MGFKTYTCPHARECGGCELLAVPYPIQIERKKGDLEDLLEPLSVKVEHVLGMEHPEAYRHKAMSPFAPGKRGLPQCGFYKRGTHDIVHVSECLVEPKIAREIIDFVAKLCQKFRIPAYDEDTGHGLLRHVIVRVARVSGQAMVTIVVNRKEFPHKRAFVVELRERFPEIASVVFNVNTRKTNAVLGPHSITAYGQGWIEDRLCGCSFRIPADAFYQTNPEQTELLYKTAIDMAQLQDGQRVLDAYCGIGTIGIIAAKMARILLVGVESVPSAVKIARENARVNHVRNAEFACGDAGEFLADDIEGFDVVFMDPPRAGASEMFLESLKVASAQRVVYISCNPTTQARDIESLSDAFRPVRAVGVDMFPHTKHLESVVLLKRI